MKTLTQKQYIKLARNLFNLRRKLEFDKENILYKKSLKYIKGKYFYRIEKDGLGPWDSFRNKTKEPDYWIDGNCSRMSIERSSSGLQDIWKSNKNKVISACYSYYNLRSWFSDNEWETLRTNGYSIKRYCIDKDFHDIFFGDTQVLIVLKKYSRSQILERTYKELKEQRKRDDEFFDIIIEGL